ncbi:nickel pincer cofactor biosynthesis protein LarB [Bacteroidota bacterium]
MDKEKIKQLLEDVASQKVDAGEAFEQLKSLPYEDLGFAKIDNHRAIRKGFPEVIFCQGKTVEQVQKIVSNMKNRNSVILATRADREMYEGIKKICDNTEYISDARIVIIGEKPKPTKTGNILVLSAGTADIPVAEEAAVTAEVMGNKVERIYDAGVAGIHRLLSYSEKINSANVLIVVAGMEGALPSVVGGLVDKPVIAVPTSVGYGASFNGLSALLTMLNSCVPGIAVVNIDNGFGAGYMAGIINSLKT